jgi:hypothetical protein
MEIIWHIKEIKYILDHIYVFNLINYGLICVFICDYMNGISELIDDDNLLILYFLITDLMSYKTLLVN